MITTQSIAKELRKRGNKTVKIIFYNVEPVNNFTIVMKDGTDYQYPKEGKLPVKTTIKEACDYIQSLDKKPATAKIGATTPKSKKISKPKKVSKLKKVIKKIRRK